MAPPRTTLLLCLLSVPALALTENPTWDIQTKVGPDAEAGGWLLNLGVTGARGRIEVDSPTVIDIGYIFPGTPAEGRLAVGDRIVGAGGRRFEVPHKFGYGMDFFGYEGPMMELGQALEAAAAVGGRLELLVLRGEEELRLSVPLGEQHRAYAEGFPYDCAKSEQILAESYAYIAGRQREDGLWPSRRPHIDAFAALALLASGDERYREHTARAARAFAAHTDDSIEYDGLDCWKYTLYAVYLAEYYLATDEDWVLPELEEIDRWLDKAQMADGGWGHRPAHRPGGNGYGSFCAMTAQAMLAWSLMMRCGLAVDRDRYDAAAAYLARGSNEVGYVWYKDSSAHPTNIADMGRTGTSALAHLLAPPARAELHARARFHAECIGDHPQTFPDTHGSPLLGLAFTALGAAADPAALRRLLDHNRWHFALARCTDGTFYYQPNRDNNAQDFHAAPRLSATAANALVLSLARRSLAITGRDGAEGAALPPLKIYFLAGQSNMVGPGSNDELETLAPPLRAPREDAWCVFSRHVPGPLGPGFGFRPGNFGPELSLGHILGEELDAPLLFFKSATGGRTLQRDFRPPSAVARAGGAVGPLYDRMLRHFHHLVENLEEVYPAYAGQGFEIAAFVWFQGESDCVAFEGERGFFEDYEANLRDLIADVRADTGVEDLPVIVVQINDSGVWDSKGGGPVVRAAQRQVAEEDPHATWVQTDDLHEGYHYDSASHITIGERIAAAAKELLRTDVDHSDGRIAAAAARFRARSRPPVEVPPALATSLREGLVSWWSFDEGEGNATRSRQDHAGELAGDTLPTWVEGLSGGALHFSGGAKVEVPGLELPQEEGRITRFSIACWVQKTSKRSGLFAGRRSRETGWLFGDAFNEGWPRTWLGTPEGGFEEHGGWDSLLTTGDGYEWRHVAVVFDGESERLEQFVNGQRVAHRQVKNEEGQRVLALPGAWSVLPGDGSLELGSNRHPRPHGHALDELGIWDRALSAEEVEALFGGGHGWVPGE